MLFEDIVKKHKKEKKISLLSMIEEVISGVDNLTSYISEQKSDPFELPHADETAPKASNESTEEELVLRLPRPRLSEKRWGKEGTEDREIIQTLLRKIIAKGTNLREKVELISDFLEHPPETDDVSEILSHIVLLDTLTSIMEHFNASAAGFTF